MEDDDNNIILMGANDNTYDDLILPFQIEKSNLRGRIVRLGTVLTDILTPHNYPAPVAQLVGEAGCLSLLLGGMLKFDGVFTLQAQGTGPVRMVISDLTTSGELRAMASYNPDRLAELGIEGNGSETVIGLRAHDHSHDLTRLMGTGHLAFTVDQGEHTERYQGIVELQGQDLSASVQHYFEQSEQIGTMLKVACGLVDGVWRAGGVMVQRLPLAEISQTPEGIAQAEDDWDTAVALLSTCTPAELLDEYGPVTDLLYRLFHEEGVRVFNPLRLKKGCRCNIDKLRGILTTMPEDDLEHMTIDGKIIMTCEFCNKNFDFDPKEIKSPD
jgi:molecular chaperone Hsp33